MNSNREKTEGDSGRPIVVGTNISNGEILAGHAKAGNRLAVDFNQLPIPIESS